jgi:hypothetical protein
MSPLFYHPIIICFTALNNIQEVDTYLYNSATSPDCHRGSERTTEMDTVESGADEANRTVNRTLKRAILLHSTSINQSVKES